MWHTREQRKLRPDEAPTQSQLVQFLRENPDLYEEMIVQDSLGGDSLEDIITDSLCFSGFVCSSPFGGVGDGSGGVAWPAVSSLRHESAIITFYPVLCYINLTPVILIVVTIINVTDNIPVLSRMYFKSTNICYFCFLLNTVRPFTEGLGRGN